MAKASNSTPLDRITAPDTASYAVLVLSADVVRGDRAEAALLGKLLPSSYSPESLLTSDGADLTARQLDDALNELSTLSLFSSRKVWRLRRADRLDAAQSKKVAGFLAALPAGVHCILRAEKLPAANAVMKRLTAEGGVWELPALAGAELRRWVEKELSLQGVRKPAPEVASLLCVIGEDQPDRIAPLVEQLVLYCGENPPALADVHRLFEVPQVSDEFELIDALSRADRGKLELLCARLLAAGKSPFPLLALIHRAFIQYARIQLHIKRTSDPNELSRLTSVPAWLVRKQLPAVRMFSREKINAILRAILIADSRLKNRSLGPEAIMSELFSVIKAA